MTAVGVEPVTSLLELLGRGDFVSMHAPLNGETHHMMTQPQFQAMKRTALFVNNGRGPTVGRGGAGQGLAGRVDRRGRARRLRARSSIATRSTTSALALTSTSDSAEA
jgi:hypothetical protein